MDPSAKQYAVKQPSIHHGLEHLFDTQRSGFSCGTCGKQFNRKGRLNVAENLELVWSKKWKCSGCELDFNSKTGMYKHMKMNHLDHKCEFCDEVFHVKARLNKHIERVHDGIDRPRVPCELCERTYADIGGLGNHLRQKHNEAPVLFLRRAKEKQTREMRLRRKQASGIQE